MATEDSSEQIPKQTERVPGTTILPLARVKRIIKEDRDVNLINPEATFCVTYATELFIEYLVNEGLTRAKRDKRKTVYYKDLASTVSEIEQFEFLEDVIPPTMTLKAALERRSDALDEEGGSSSAPPAKRQKSEHDQQAAAAAAIPSQITEDKMESQEADDEKPVSNDDVAPQQEQQTPSQE
ncbi:hypothetical protein VTP01DRAFT_9980 [Rhizomucor pusillus]|uniref:uncharacterized protein n=1 Tax=Rhizomucor pusillus TaxID=4840 RepID=UPI0037428FFD